MEGPIDGGRRRPADSRVRCLRHRGCLAFGILLSGDEAIFQASQPQWRETTRWRKKEIVAGSSSATRVELDFEKGTSGASAWPMDVCMTEPLTKTDHSTAWSTSGGASSQDAASHSTTQFHHRRALPRPSISTAYPHPYPERPASLSYIARMALMSPTMAWTGYVARQLSSNATF